MATIYEQTVKTLEDLKCPSCRGAGECDDADLGDIAFSRWECDTCSGTGFKEGRIFKLIHEVPRKKT